MHPVSALQRLGGVSDRSTLLLMTSRRRLRTAVRKDEIVRAGRNRYVLPTASQGIRAAGRVAGVASHLTAASLHGWEIVRQPERPQVIVPRGRKIELARRQGIEVRWRTPLGEHEVAHGIVTEPHRTVIDCARDLPFADALAVADSALRRGQVDRDRLVAMALGLSTNGRTQALRVVNAADGRAANPFESALRAIALDVPGLTVEPQVVIDDRGFYGHPDLVDRMRRVVIEADSFEWHGHRSALKRDCERYNALVLRGWTVIRFAWEHVVVEPEYVHNCLVAIVEGPRERTTRLPALPYSA
ncbi:MAG: hypothetical protein QOK15_2122 [Nocardioidaceae bacterium]|nr:hypothetical protein [Nocardioidaceae bacterium]